MRNIFDQYENLENRLTHALACSLSEDPALLRSFIRWVTGKQAPKGKLQIVEQQRPGDAEKRESDSEGIPDAWIFNDEGWALLIESKVAAPLDNGQLKRHLATATRRGFSTVTLLTLTANGQVPSLKAGAVGRTWTALYGWLLRQRSQSTWASRCMAYMEVLEADMIEKRYLKEGEVTSFAGIPFNRENPYSYLEAKRLIRLIMTRLRDDSRLVRELAVDPKALGRGAITGRESQAVWDFLRLRASSGTGQFTKFPHLTLAIQSNRAVVIVTVPHGIRTDFRRNLVSLGRDGFAELASTLNKRILAALKGDQGAAPMIELVQRRYPSQRAIPIIDAKLEFDTRTACGSTRPKGGNGVKVQPQWLDAAFDALSNKQSNLQFGVGAIFPYDRSISVGQAAFLDRVAGVWIACKPLLAAMGVLRP